VVGGVGGGGRGGEGGVGKEVGMCVEVEDNSDSCRKWGGNGGCEGE